MSYIYWIGVTLIKNFNDYSAINRYIIFFIKSLISTALVESRVLYGDFRHRCTRFYSDG